MRFLVHATERQTLDPQEEAAMIRYRINSIQHLMELLQKEVLAYAFKSDDGHSTYMMVETNSLETLDRIIKRNPLFPYSDFTVTPMISSRSMVEEIHDYLGERVLAEKEMGDLEPKLFSIEASANYILVDKSIPTMSPLLSEEEQRDIHRRTVLAQRIHSSPIEMSDDNPVGKPVGILIVKSDSPEEVFQHVANTPIYPDTTVKFIPLKTLEQSLEGSRERLRQLGKEPG